MTMRQRITALLSDGKPRSTREIAAKLEHPQTRVSDAVGLMARRGLLEPVAGCADTANWPALNRYVLAEVTVAA